MYDTFLLHASDIINMLRGCIMKQYRCGSVQSVAVINNNIIIIMRVYIQGIRYTG